MTRPDRRTPPTAARTVIQRHPEHLDQVEWPATRSTLLECASQSQAPQDLLAELCSLPDDEVTYRDFTAVVHRVRLMRILSANF